MLCGLQPLSKHTPPSTLNLDSRTRSSGTPLHTPSPEYPESWNDPTLVSPQHHSLGPTSPKPLQPGVLVQGLLLIWGTVRWSEIMPFELLSAGNLKSILTDICCVIDRARKNELEAGFAPVMQQQSSWIRWCGDDDICSSEFYGHRARPSPLQRGKDEVRRPVRQVRESVHR